MKYLQLIALSLFIFGCSNENGTTNSDASEINMDKDTLEVETPESLVEVKGKMYTEYYPGKKSIKFQGPQDEEQRRHGEWQFYSPTGEMMSTAMYKHGVRHGQIIVKYENGQINYVGEFKDGVKVGIWKSYTREGDLIEEKDLGGK